MRQFETNARAALESIEAARTGKVYEEYNSATAWLANAAREITAAFKFLNDDTMPECQEISARVRASVTDWPLLSQTILRLLPPERVEREGQVTKGGLAVAINLEVLARRLTELVEKR